jgi:hypothetical protein
MPTNLTALPCKYAWCTSQNPGQGGRWGTVNEWGEVNIYKHQKLAGRGKVLLEILQVLHPLEETHTHTSCTQDVELSGVRISTSEYIAEKQSQDGPVKQLDIGSNREPLTIQQLRVPTAVGIYIWQHDDAPLAQCLVAFRGRGTIGCLHQELALQGVGVLPRDDAPDGSWNQHVALQAQNVLFVDLLPCECRQLVVVHHTVETSATNTACIARLTEIALII